MTTIAEIRAWLDTLGPESTVAIDDGGLTLVELDKGTEPTGAYLEVGGVPVDPEIPGDLGELKCDACGTTLENDGQDIACPFCGLVFDPSGEDPTWQRHEWEHEVGEHDTNLGYWEWVAHQKEAALDKVQGL